MSKRSAAVSMGLVLVAATGVTATRAHAQPQPVAQRVSTLREALIKHEIPLERGAPADLDRPLPSYAIDDSPDLFVIGFDVGDSLRVSAFDRRTHTWSHAWLERSRQRAPAWDVGSLLKIHHTEQHIVLDTHQSPSAGTVIVLSRSLVPVTTPAGWVVRALPTGTVVYQRGDVHFAPTHALELWTWNPETSRDVQLYPVEPADSVRRAYVDTVRSIYQRVGEAWFRQQNHHMDPERFDSRLATSVVASPSGRELIFLVRYGGGDGTAAATPTLHVVVRCRGVGTPDARCVEQRLGLRR